AAPTCDADRYEQACRGDGDVNACRERMHALCGCRVDGRVHEDRRGRDREDDRAADLERASDETGCEALLVVAHPAQRLDVERGVGEAEAKPGQETRSDDDLV